MPWRLYGPETLPTRKLLTDYVQRAIDGTWPQSGQPAVVEDPDAGRLLDQVEESLKRIDPPDGRHQQLWNGALQRLENVVQLRWRLIEELSRTVSTPLLVILVCWLMLIFASFGYNAPRNSIVVVTFLLCTASIATAVYLIIEMDLPFTGAIQISPEPLQRALAFIKQ